MLGPVGAWPPSTWTPVRGYAPSPSLPTLATQVLSSFPPLLQLLQSYATMEEQTKRAIDSVHCASAHQAAQRVAEQASFCISGAQFHPSLCFSGFYVALFQQLYLLPLSPWYLLCPVPQSFLLFFSTASVTSTPSSSTVSCHQACCPRDPEGCCGELLPECLARKG